MRVIKYSFTILRVQSGDNILLSGDENLLGAGYGIEGSKPDFPNIPLSPAQKQTSHVATLRKNQHVYLYQSNLPIWSSKRHVTQVKNCRKKSVQRM
jgi:hypothetical protein